MVEAADASSLQGFIREKIRPGSTAYTDEAAAYKGLEENYEHETVNHSVGEYVREQASTNGLESFWSALHRAHRGTFHYLSAKHLQRCIDDFSARHNERDHDTIVKMGNLAAGMAGKYLRWEDLTVESNSKKDFSTSSHEEQHQSSTEPPRIPLPVAAE